MAFHLVTLPRRIYRVAWGTDPLAFAPLAVLQEHGPGRWDDRTYRFRTSYFGDSLVTCFVEVLADLRPDPKTVAKLRALGAAPPNMDVAIAQSLRLKSAAVVLTSEAPVVDIVQAHSRTEFEVATRRKRKTKAGDFLSRDLRIPRRAAGVVYDATHCGLCAPSAEALAIDPKADAITYNLFETTLDAESFRATLVTHMVRPAEEQQIEIAAARNFLGID